MKKILVFMNVLAIVACGGGEENTTSQENKSKKSTLLSESLKNTSWTMPDYPVAGVTIMENTASVSMSETSFVSNGNISVLEDDSKNNFVVFNVYSTNTNAIDNRVLAISMIDPETIEVSIIQNSNSLEGYKKSHERFKVQMKKQ